MSIDLLRQIIRERRRQLGIGAQLRAARRLCRLLKKSDLIQQSQKIALYLPMDGELDCRRLLRELWRQGKHCFLPVLVPQKTGLKMEFVQYHPGTVLKKNRFGILEPKAGAKCSVADLDLVLVPLVAFDIHGNRVGMGGGFYDRTFEFCEHVSRRPYLLGVAHQLQQVPALTPSPWDIRMDKVISC